MTKLHFDILTIFPKMIEDGLSHSIVGRGLAKSAFSFACHDLRNYGLGNYQKLDDKLYGGGKGMLMLCEPIWQALDSLLPEYDLTSLPQDTFLPKSGDLSQAFASVRDEANQPFLKSEKKLPRRIYLSPKGKILNQSLALELAQEERVILLCGHYEGVDQRVLDKAGFEEVSIGDFVLTGGELAAMVLIDSVVRMLPEVLSKEAVEQESHMNKLLEAKQYTKPRIWQGLEVPSVLFSGNHAKIEKYRRLSSLLETLKKRPDLFAAHQLSMEEIEDLISFARDENKFN